METYCELHVHLEGCVWDEHVRYWWPKSEFLFPFPRYNAMHCRGFDRFLEHLRFGYNFLNTEDAYANVAEIYARRSFQAGVRYAEVQLNLALLNTWNITLLAVLQRINERVSEVFCHPTLRFIVDIPWQFDPRQLLIVVDLVEQLYPLGVRAVSFGGDELLARPAEVLEILPEIRKSGLQVHCHAGEGTDPINAQNIVEAIEPDRIVHGVSIADWIESRGTESPPIDVCLASNTQLGVVSDLRFHPLKRWWQAGVPVSLSTDDPAVFQTTLQQEYELATEICPEINADREMVVQHWLRAATDQAAAKASLDTCSNELM